MPGLWLGLGSALGRLWSRGYICGWGWSGALLRSGLGLVPGLRPVLGPGLRRVLGRPDLGVGLGLGLGPLTGSAAGSGTMNGVRAPAADLILYL